MSRGFLAVARFVIGVACIAVVFKFLGIGWNEVNFFLENIKNSFEIFNVFKGIAG